MLNTCEGARGGQRDIFSSTAAILVRYGIPAVLAMQYAITDAAAMVFSRAFYEALSDGMPIDAAVSEARKAVSFEVENTLEWGVPVLFMRSPNGVLFTIDQGGSTPPPRPSLQETPITNPSPSTPPITGVPQPRPQPAQVSRGRLILLMIALIGIVIAGSIGLFFWLSNPPPPPPPPTPAPAATPTATAHAEKNPYPPYTGTLVLNDPLTANNKDYKWDEGTNNNNATCQFTGNGLNVTQPKVGYFRGCIAKTTDFSNFAYEVQMTTISGDYAGIIFCADTIRGTYYFFYLTLDGSYTLKIYGNGPDTGRVVKSGSSSVILTGPNSSNTIAVVVHNGTIDLYVNQRHIDTVSDSSYSHGQIGVFAGNDGHAAEAVFSNAKVWKL